MPHDAATISSSKPRLGWRARIAAVSLRDIVVSVGPTALVILAAIIVAVRFLRPAPPDAIRMLGGAEGSSYRTNAEKYKAIIEKHGVKVEILPSKGAFDNLERLANGAGRVDVGFVQSGLTEKVDPTTGRAEKQEIEGLVSLGTVFAQPLVVYYRNETPIELLTELRGKRVAIGPEGSGTRVLSKRLLEINEMTGPPTTLVDLGGEEAAHALVEGKIDAAFLMGDSATPKIMKALRAAPGVSLMNFRQAAGYVRRHRFLTRLVLPEGAYDLARNYPPKTYDLIGPTVELVARRDLHPALSDLLIGAAKEVHGTAGLFRDAGEYPRPDLRDFPISEDAERYYKSGGQFLYRRMPFWFASLVDRLMVVIVPLLVIIVPAMRIAPALYRWRVRSRIYRWYGALMAIEREILARPGPEAREDIRRRLNGIEDAVDEIKTPLSFADQLYVLHEHVGLVRRRLESL